MKKLIVPVLALALALTLAACGNSGGNSGAGQSGGTSPQASSPAPSQQQTPSEPSAPQQSGGAAADGMSGRLADAYIGMFNGGKYYMKYRSSQEYEGEKMETVAEMAGFESSFEGMTVQMEILEISETIPAGMFDIPEGYEVTEY